MKIKNHGIILAWLIIASALMTGCHKNEIINKQASDPYNFLEKVRANPVIIDGFELGDSWRLLREQGSYNDGGFQKEFDYDLLNDNEHIQYKEYWVFDSEKVMLVSAGTRFDKKWDGYYDTFDQATDVANKTLTIDHVYDEGNKAYTRHWRITRLTATELILTDENVQENYFYQYTFRREAFHN